MSTLTNTPLPIPEGMMRSLQTAYAHPPRAYHSFAHVQEVVRHFHTVPTWQRPKEVFLAVLFHDAVYLAGKSNNEAKSAELAVEAIKTFLPKENLDVAAVRTLIELTAKHGKVDRADLDDDTRHFLDCDMAIIGAPPAQFDAYNFAIAQEYSSVPPVIYRFNRKRFLKRLLDSERIFLSDFFHTRLDAPARANLERALKRGN